MLLFEHEPHDLLTVDELYSRLDPLVMAQLEEDRRIERKSPGIHAADLADYLVVFSNTPPDGGIILVGIEDDGTVVGCQDISTQRRNNLERCGDTHTTGARYDVRTVAVTTSKGSPGFLLAFRVSYSKDRLIENTKGDAFIRRGDSKKKLTEEEKRELRVSRGELSTEFEPCRQYVFPTDFDELLVQQFTSSFLQSRDLDENERSAEEVLELKHLGKRVGMKFTPNLACVLLFARDPLPAVPGCRVRILRFEGEHERTGEKYNAVKDYWVDGPVPKLIVESESIIQAQLRDFSRLGPDGKFYTAPEYPKPAWYEALVNACVHRSYNLRNMNVFVRMFDDRVEFESPGGFPGIVTPENIYEIHEPRNPFLMEAMYYLRFVKCAREGTRRMRETMKSFSLPAPEFSQAHAPCDVVRVVLRNNIKQRKVWIDSNVGSLIGEALFEVLSEDERRALNFVAENGSIGVSQLQRLTGRSWPAAKKVLERLVQAGILEHHVREELDRDPKARYALRRNGPKRAPHK